MLLAATDTEAFEYRQPKESCLGPAAIEKSQTFWKKHLTSVRDDDTFMRVMNRPSTYLLLFIATGLFALASSVHAGRGPRLGSLTPPPPATIQETSPR